MNRAGYVNLLTLPDHDHHHVYHHYQDFAGGDDQYIPS